MSRIRTTGFHVTSVALGVLFLLPLLWTLYSSLNGREAANGGPGGRTVNVTGMVMALEDPVGAVMVTAP